MANESSVTGKRQTSNRGRSIQHHFGPPLENRLKLAELILGMNQPSIQSLSPLFGLTKLLAGNTPGG